MQDRHITDLQPVDELEDDVVEDVVLRERQVADLDVAPVVGRGGWYRYRRLDESRIGITTVINHNRGVSLAGEYFAAVREDIEQWVGEGRSWRARGPLLLWGIFILVRVILNSQTFTPFDWLDLCLHEIGHVLFRVFGQFMSIAGGSIVQVAVPLIAAVMFFRQRDYFAVSFTFCWLGESLLNLGHYVGDAVLEELPLVGLFGGEPIHDWHYLLRHLGMLTHTNLLAGAIRVAAFLSVSFFLVSGGWLVWKMRRAGRSTSDNGEVQL